jgi:hypothetical protein
VSAAYDAATCRLAYAWSGNFLDAAGAWAERGGAPARPLGPKFWTAPLGCPVGVGDVVPDFAARAKDPAFGALPPEGQVFKGARRLHFDGYGMAPDGGPTFRYRLDDDRDLQLGVLEHLQPMTSALGVGLRRRFTLLAQPHHTVWLRVGESPREPRLLDARGTPLPLDLKAEPVTLPPEGRWLVLPQDGERVVLLSLFRAPPDSAWRLYRAGGVWQAVVHVPPPVQAVQVHVEVRLWAPYRDEPGLFRELLSAR